VIALSMRGVMSATIKFVSQLVAIDTPTALDRTPGGKISEGMIQLTQPGHVSGYTYLGGDVQLTNGERKIGNEIPNEHSCRPSSSTMLSPRVFIHSVQCTDDQVSKGHIDSTDDQYLPATPPIQKHDGGNRGKEIDNSDDSRSQKIDRITSETNGGEDLRSIVDDRVDACELLNDLEQAGDNETSVEMADNEQFLILLHGQSETGCNPGESS